MGISRIVLAVLAALAVIATIALGVTGSTTGVLFAGIAAGWLICLALMSWDLAAGLSLVGLSGAGVSVYLAKQHLAALHGGEASICTVSEVLNCDVVNTSQYSELFGLPVAVYGIGFYFAVAFAAGLRRMGRARLAGLAHVLVLAGVGSIFYSVFLAWASWQLGAWCLFCISLYGLNALLLGGSIVALRNPKALKAEADKAAEGGFVGALAGRSGDRTVTVMTLGGMAVFLISIVVYQGQKSDLTGGGGSDGEIPDGAYYQLKGELQLHGQEPIYGKASAPYMIVEWADYACPYCARAGAEVKEMIDAQPDVQLRYKHYPISNICNRHIGGEGHTTACDASAAAECARMQGRFWELSDLLFKNQRYQSDEDLRFMAKQIGLDMEAFEACMGAEAAEQLIALDADHANAVDVTGTPTFFIKGLFGDQFVQVRADPAVIKAVIDAHRAGVALDAPGPAPEKKKK